MVLKSIVPPLTLKFISINKTLYYLFSLFVFIFLLKIVMNDKEKNSVNFTTLSETETDYRKRYNLNI